MKIWEKKTLNIKSTDAYWEYNKENIVDVPRSELKEFENKWIKLQVWTKLTTDMLWDVEIKWISNEYITLDLNHFLAWQDLIFKVEIIWFNN